MQRRILPERRRDFFLGLELPSRNRMLILRTSPASVAGQASVPESRGLTVRTLDRDTDPPSTEVELVLTDQQQRDIFDVLIKDLVEAAEQPNDERFGVSRFLARLADWQRLFLRLAPGALSREGQQGLWGELWTLREVAAPVVGFCAATRAWRGPLGADQDLQLPGAALEVKTSTSHAFERLIVASERQLDVATDVELALLALSLDARPDHGETLSEMVRAVRSAAAEAGCLQPLEERLVLFGYRDADSDRYADIGYTIRSRHQFRVQDGFPRIVPSDLRPGVADATYSVAIAACAPYELTDRELAELLRGNL
jgi:hypothetical protein